MREIFVKAKKFSPHSDEERRQLVQRYMTQYSIRIRPFMALVHSHSGSVSLSKDEKGNKTGYLIDAYNPIGTEGLTILHWLVIGHELGHIELIERAIKEDAYADWVIIERWCDQFSIVLLGLQHAHVDEHLIGPEAYEDDDDIMML